jgi:hypothetical protein
MRHWDFHPARLDEADRQRHTKNPVPVWVGILVAAAVLAIFAILDAHGIER